MSPNLSIGHFSPNKLLYEQKKKPYFSTDKDSQEMFVSDRDLQMFNNGCEFKYFDKDAVKKN
uniref:Uncharacterized protein n=1 Tax=Wuchereria bancrofti TaxID=6293 RepID=A0AAF5PUC7_WUCBA